MSKQSDELSFEKLKKHFFFNGNVLIPLKKGNVYTRLNKEIIDLNHRDLSENQQFKQSYGSTFDLVKGDNPITNLIMDFLIENDFAGTIKKVAGLDYRLGDFTFRKTYAKKSYMSWHRDTYVNTSGEIIGRIPPLIKLIYYPQTSLTPQKCLHFVPGSHRKFFKAPFVDRFQYLLARKKVVESSNQNVIMFDSSILHSAASSSQANGDFRLIFNFCHADHVSNFRDGKIVQNLLYRKG